MHVHYTTTTTECALNKLWPAEWNVCNKIRTNKIQWTNLQLFPLHIQTCKMVSELELKPSNYTSTKDFINIGKQLLTNHIWETKRQDTVLLLKLFQNCQIFWGKHYLKCHLRTFIHLKLESYFWFHWHFYSFNLALGFVPAQGIVPCETFPAFFALIKLLSSVNSFVPDTTFFASICFFTIGTLERPNSTVDQLMPHCMPGCTKALETNSTIVLPLHFTSPLHHVSL